MLESESMDEEQFVAIFDGYFFEADLGNGKSVELLDNGAEKALTGQNVQQYVDLYLKAYTRLDEKQF